MRVLGSLLFGLIATTLLAGCVKAHKVVIKNGYPFDVRWVQKDGVKLTIPKNSDFVTRRVIRVGDEFVFEAKGSDRVRHRIVDIESRSPEPGTYEFSLVPAGNVWAVDCHMPPQ